MAPVIQRWKKQIADAGFTTANEPVNKSGVLKLGDEIQLLKISIIEQFSLQVVKTSIRRVLESGRLRMYLAQGVDKCRFFIIYVCMYACTRCHRFCSRI
jgi:hypothetical protein